MLLAPFRPKRFPLLLCTIAVVAAVTAAAFCKANKTVPVGAGVSAVEGEIKLPVIMYHSMLKEQKRQGKYVISPNTFESDLQYLHSRGYKTITVA